MITILGNRVLVKRLDNPKLKSSIIEVVEHNPDPSQYGIVLAVSDEVKRIKPGDTVIMGKYSGAVVNVTIKNKDMEAIIVTADDVLAILDEERKK